jgi:hypothetical protein
MGIGEATAGLFTEGRANVITADYSEKKDKQGAGPFKLMAEKRALSPFPGQAGHQSRQLRLPIGLS